MNILKVFGIGQTEEERVEKAFQAYRQEQQRLAEIGLGVVHGSKCECGNHVTDDDRYCGSCGKSIF